MDLPSDIASVTIAGYSFALQEKSGGMLNLRISLRNAALADLARALAKLEGVRVVSGPAIVDRGICYLVHCPGFKMVLSLPAPDADFAHALLSRTPEPTLAVTCELGTVFARLMDAPAPQPEKGRSRWPGSVAVTADRLVLTRTSALRRTVLQPGKALARKTPLRRKTPLARGRRFKP